MTKLRHSSNITKKRSYHLQTVATLYDKTCESHPKFEVHEQSEQREEQRNLLYGRLENVNIIEHDARYWCLHILVYINLTIYLLPLPSRLAESLVYYIAIIDYTPRLTNTLGSKSNM
jgi:hypothetical protein